MKTSEIQPGDQVEFHHHRHGKRKGTYVAKHGKRHHHVVMAGGAGEDHHLSVHEEAITSAKSAGHRARNTRLRRVLDRTQGDPRKSMGDLAPAHAKANLHKALALPEPRDMEGIAPGGAGVHEDEYAGGPTRRRRGRRR